MGEERSSAAAAVRVAISSHPLNKLLFPKENRLLRRSEFDDLLRKGKKKAGALLLVTGWLSLKGGPPRLGITVSRRFGKAYERNLFKRRTREAFRHLLPSLPLGLHISISPRSLAKSATQSAMREEIRGLVNDYITSETQSQRP